MTVAEAWQEERSGLMPTPAAFDGFVEHTKRVSPSCLIHFERNRYSVPASFANRPVSLRVYADHLVVAAEGQVITGHSRVIERNHSVSGKTIYDWRHYLSVLQRKPGALRNGAPFAEFPDGFKRLQSQLLKRPGGDREMVEILALVLHHDEQAVLTAVEMALDCGMPSKQHVLNLLGRLVELAPSETLFQRPNHPYTQALPADLPRLDRRRRDYRPIEGELPSPLDPPPGCHFHPRCRFATARCRAEAPALREVAPGHHSACHLNEGG